jgi:hypothetical protein
VSYQDAMSPGAQGPSYPEEPEGDLTDAIVAARRGFRRDVAELVRALQNGRLLVPLAQRIEGAELGVEREVGDELSLSPHLLFDDEHAGYLPVFTRGPLLERATDRIGWTTGDGPLEYCALPARVVLELAVAILEDDRVQGMLVNPFDDSELVLRRHELASIAQGRPLPLVGYVAEIPLGEDEQRLVAKMDGPPPSEIVGAVEKVLAEHGGTRGYGLHRTFNPERDLEPHLTLNVLSGDAPLDRGALAGHIAAELEGKLPPPGYIDILFDDPALS